MTTDGAGSGGSRVARFAVIGSAVVVLLWIVAVGVLSSMVLRPPWYRNPTPAEGLWMGWETPPPFWDGIHSDPKRDLGLDFEVVEFPAEDGAVLRGWFVPAGAERERIVIAVHGGGADRRDWLRHVPVFTGAGIPVLLFDCREQGISDGSGAGVTFGAREYRDVISAVDWVVDERGFEHVAVAGTSQGGASVLLAAASDARIDVVIAENPFTTIEALLTDQGIPIPAPLLVPLRPLARWRTYGSAPQPIDVVAEIAPRPILFIHGTADSVIPYQHSEELFERAGEPKELWLAEGADHTTSYNLHPEQYRQRVRHFLNAHLR